MSASQTLESRKVHAVKAVSDAFVDGHARTVKAVSDALVEGHARTVKAVSDALVESHARTIKAVSNTLVDGHRGTAETMASALIEYMEAADAAAEVRVDEKIRGMREHMDIRLDRQDATLRMVWKQVKGNGKLPIDDPLP